MGKSKKKSKKEHKESKEHKVKHKIKKCKKHSKHKEKLEVAKVEREPEPETEPQPQPLVAESEEDFSIPIALMNNKSHAPETQEEYQRRQSKIRREYDAPTGRILLIKGDSEILEEIVTKSRHNQINKNATRADGIYYEGEVIAAARKKQSKPK